MQKQLTNVLVIQNLLFIIGGYMYISYIKKGKTLIRDIDIKYRKKIDLLVKTGLGIAYICVFASFAIPSIMDIPSLKEEKYCVITGIAEYNSVPNSRGRSIIVSTEGEESVEIKIYGRCDNIRIGDELKVKYLPHTQYGCVIEHNGKKHDN